MRWLLVCVGLLLGSQGAQAQCVVPNTLVDGVTIFATPLNQNFSALANCVSNGVASNAVLSTTSTLTFPIGVWRFDYAAGLGSSPVFYLPSAAPCGLNSGLGDGGSQVPSSNGKCWLAVFPASGADIRAWGVNFDGATNNATALTSALTWAGTNGTTVTCPDAASAALFSTAITINIAASKRLGLIGNGHDSCRLAYTGASGSGLTFSIGANTSTAVLKGFTLTTNRAGGVTGITLTNTMVATGGFQNSPTIVDDVVIQGDDVHTAATHYFATGILVNGWSYIDFSRVSVFAVPVASVPVVGTFAIDLESPNGPGFVGVVYNFHSPNIAYYDRSINVGTYIQGVVVDAGGNFDAVNYGVYVGNFTGTGQLTVKNSQWNVLKRAIFGEPATLIFEGNYVIMQNGNNAAGLELDPPVGGCIIGDNVFEEIGTVNVTGVIFGNQAPIIPCQVHDNDFWLAGSGNMAGTNYAIATSFDTTFFSNNHYTKGNTGVGTMFPFVTSGMMFIGDQPQAFSTLTGCTSAVEQNGRQASVNDSTTLTWGNTITGTGVGQARAYCDGTNWTVMGK